MNHSDRFFESGRTKANWKLRGGLPLGTLDSFFYFYFLLSFYQILLLKNLCDNFFLKRNFLIYWEREENKDKLHLTPWWFDRNRFSPAVKSFTSTGCLKKKLKTGIERLILSIKLNRSIYIINFDRFGFEIYINRV